MFPAVRNLGSKIEKAAIRTSVVQKMTSSCVSLNDGIPRTRCSERLMFRSTVAGFGRRDRAKPSRKIDCSRPSLFPRLQQALLGGQDERGRPASCKALFLTPCFVFLILPHCDEIRDRLHHTERDH